MNKSSRCLIRKGLPYFALLLLFCCSTELAYAANSLSTAATSLSTNIQSLGKVVKWAIVLVGFVLVGTGVNGFIQAQKREESLAGPLTSIVVGAIMISIVAFVSMGSQTVLGSDGATSDLNSLISN